MGAWNVSIKWKVAVIIPILNAEKTELRKNEDYSWWAASQRAAVKSLQSLPLLCKGVMPSGPQARDPTRTFLHEWHLFPRSCTTRWSWTCHHSNSEAQSHLLLHLKPGKLIWSFFSYKLHGMYCVLLCMYVCMCTYVYLLVCVWHQIGYEKSY